MDLPNRALATADTVKRTVSETLREKSDAIISAAVARGDRISKHPSIVILTSPLRRPATDPESEISPVRPHLLGNALALGIEFVGRADAALGLNLLSRDDPSCRTQDRSEDDDDEAVDEHFRMIPRPLQVQVRHMFTVHFSRFASLRVAVTCSRDACEALTQRLQSQAARPIFAKLAVAGVQHQLTRRAENVSRLAPIAVSAVQKVFGDRLTGQACELIQRLAETLIGTQQLQTTVGDDESGPLIEEVVDNEPAPDCAVLQGERGPVIHVPLCDADGAPASGYIEPVDFKLIERNGFLEFQEEASPLLRRVRSCSDTMGRDLVAISSRCNPFSLPFNCVSPKSPESKASAKQASKTSSDKSSQGSGTTTAQRDDRSVVPQCQSPTCGSVPSTTLIRSGSGSGSGSVCGPSGASWAGSSPERFEAAQISPDAGQPACVAQGDQGTSNSEDILVGNTPGECSTVQLRNLPVDWSRSALLNLLDTTGFKERYRFVYLPMNFTMGGCLGYADVCMATTADACELLHKLQGFLVQGLVGPSAVETRWCEQARQNLEDLVQRYRDSPVMHHSVSDEHRPALFENGVRVNFPPPTKPLRRPRVRHQKE